MDTLTVKFEIVEEGIGFGMSELKEYVMSQETQNVSPWAGRWAECYKSRVVEEKKEQPDGVAD